MLLIILSILVLIAGLFLPWWVLAIICFIGALWLGRSGWQAFGSGFAAVFVAWLILALMKSIPNHNILANRVANLFFMPNWTCLLLVTGIIGGLVGGFACLTGYSFKLLFANPTPPNNIKG